MTKGLCFGTFLLACLISSFDLIASEPPSTVEMKVKTITLDPTSQTPVVLLEGLQDKALLPIWIGNAEAASIAMELEHVATPRPLTHDLMRNILKGLGATLNRITITEIRNSTYFANLTLQYKGQEFQIDSRPSDAIALALRMKAPIYASPQVLAKARKLPVPSKQSEELRQTFGIHAQELTPELAGLFDMPVQRGVLIADVELASAAAQGGLQRGDLILKVNDRTIQTVAELESSLQASKKSRQAKIEVLRKGKNTTVVLNLPA
jgi:bifunctional DNase/RNase